MKTLLSLAVVTLLVASCASKKTMDSSDARQSIEDKFANRIGVATKEDFVQEFGNANWCRPSPTGDENCRFYQKVGTKWTGEKTDKTYREAFNEVFAEFDTTGVLKSFKVNAQR